MHLNFSGNMFSLNDYTFYPTYKKIMSIELQTNFFRKTGLAFASSYVNGPFQFEDRLNFKPAGNTCS